MRAGAQSGFFTSLTPEPSQCLHTVGAQQIIVGQMNESSGPGRTVDGRWGEGAPGRGSCASRDLGEAAAALGPDEVELGGSEGRCGERWTWAGTAVSRPAAIPGRMFSLLVVDTWRAGVPGSLCKALGCFSRTKSKALSSGENSACLTSRAKWQEAPTPACCPQEPEKCPNVSALGGSADCPAAAGSSRVGARDLLLLVPSLALPGCQGPGDPSG